MAHGCSIKYPLRIFVDWKNQTVSCYCFHIPYFTPFQDVVVSPFFELACCVFLEAVIV